MKLMLPFARRFVAGTQSHDAMFAVELLNRDGLVATLDILGESVTNRDAANHAADEYIALIPQISQRGLKCNVSLKLSQMGLEIDANLAYENCARILEACRPHNNFVRIDMEGSNLTQATLDVFWRLREKYDNVGIVLQAYLHRTEKDIQDLIDRGGSVRLCKGAYKESPNIAFKDMGDIRRNYVLLMTRLFEAVKAGKPVKVAIATHDDYLIRQAQEISQKIGLRKDQFELQMLYGLRRRFGRELAEQGYSVRSYVPYGHEWFPYFYRRLRERKENITFLLSNFFKD